MKSLNKGYNDWIVQRVSGMYMATYLITFIIILFCRNDMSYDGLQGFFALNIVKISTVLFLLSLISHAWIGMWTIATDYIKTIPIRNAFYMVVGLILVFDFLLGINIIWSV